MFEYNRLRVVSLLLSLAIAGCAVPSIRDEPWPQEIPAREWFLTRYLTDAPNQAVQRHQEYLRWVTRFYYGWLAHPQGWLRVTEGAIAAVAEDRRAELSRRMTLVGRRVAGEWAKQSSDRLISNRAMASWIKALTLASEAGTVEQVLERIAADVDGLFAGELNLAEVTVDRYVPGGEAIAAFER